MNILTFDIEEWYLEKRYRNGDKEKYELYDNMLGRILDLLDTYSINATFFCLGSLAGSFPDVVKRISARGHEIGCHSLLHKWVNKMTPDDFLKDTSEAISKLEDCIGKKIISYRAPAFSIGEDSKWAFQVLHECGIENDASIFPGTRDFGGFPSFSGEAKPCIIVYDGIRINEFPISMTKLPIFGKDTAYSGGGYFRIYPLTFVKSRMRTAEYVMCYFHIADLIEKKSQFQTRKEHEEYFKETGTLTRRLARYFKSNVGRKRTFNGLESLLGEFDFIDIADAAGSSDQFTEVYL